EIRETARLDKQPQTLRNVFKKRFDLLWQVDQCAAEGAIARDGCPQVLQPQQHRRERSRHNPALLVGVEKLQRYTARSLQRLSLGTSYRDGAQIVILLHQLRDANGLRRAAIA